MKSYKDWAVGAAFVLIGACWNSICTAQVPCMAPGCYGSCVHQKGLEVGCAPRRITYGYYPTLWRRWPTGSVAHLPTTAAEPTPSITQPTQPTDELPAPGGEYAGPTLTPDLPGQPTLTPDQPTIQPDEPAPGPAAPGFDTPTPSADEPDTLLPFADEPPAPPTDAPNSSRGTPSSGPAPPSLPTPSPDLPSPSTNDPAPELPGLEPQIQAPPRDDAPPTMPDDDPFKDDPVQPDSTQDTPPSEAPRQTTTSSTSEPNVPTAPGKLRWRNAGVPTARKTTAVEVPPATAATSSREPTHRPAVATRPQRDDALAATGTTVEPGQLTAAVLESQQPEIGHSVPHPTAEKPRRLPPANLAKGVNPLRRSTPAREAGPVVATAAWSLNQPVPTTAARPSRHNPLRDN